MALPTTTTIAWRVRFLGLSFFLLFFAYSSAQTLESTLNGAAGFLCLSLIYAFLAVSFLCAPYIVSLVGERRLPALFFCAALFYVAFVSSKLLRSGPASAVLGLLSCAGVGLGGGRCGQRRAFTLRAPLQPTTPWPPWTLAPPSPASPRCSIAAFTPFGCSQGRPAMPFPRLSCSPSLTLRAPWQRSLRCSQWWAAAACWP